MISDNDDDASTDNGKDQLRDMEFKLTHDLTQLQVSLGLPQCLCVHHE